MLVSISDRRLSNVWENPRCAKFKFMALQILSRICMFEFPIQHRLLAQIAKHRICA